MSNKEFVLSAMRRQGRTAALVLQEEAGTMSGTELNKQYNYIPDFQASKTKENMLNRPIGFICKSPTGRIVKLLQPYDSDIYPDEPEALPAQWGFQWSQDPDRALPFIALSTSPYKSGDCCTENGITYCSLIDGNVWAPSAYPEGWKTCEQEASE